MQSPDHDTAASPDQGRDNRPSAPWLEAFTTALAFFTRLPVRPATLHPLGACALGFAPAGAVIGLILGAVFVLLAGLGVPGLVGALLVIGCGLVLTGALHEDGLADCADALATADRERALAIMRDSRVGSYGALALVLSVGLRVAALVSLPGSVVLAALIGAHAFSRGALAVMLDRLPPARSDGLGATAGRPRQAMLALGLGAAILLLACLFFAGIGPGLFALALGGLAGLAVLEVARRRYGGHTGDVLGAMQQCVEVATLLAFTLFY